jgi:hypothetical protein
MAKKNKSPNSLKNYGILSLTLPALKFKAEGSCSPSPEEDKAHQLFDEAFDEAAKKSPVIDAINFVESQKPKSISEMAQKRNLLNDLRDELKAINALPETDVEKIPCGKPDIPLPQKQTDMENFIRSLQVAFVNDTEIRIKGGNKNAKKYDKKELGFIKENSKIWDEFINILKSNDHYYHVGKARGAKMVRKKSYNVAQKVLVEINKRLVSFFNETFQLQLPKNYKTYELIPYKNDAPGKYRFKFKIKNNSDADIKGFEKLSKDELLSQIETLSGEYRKLSKEGNEEAEKKILKIKDQLNDAVVIACSEGWLAQNRARSYLNSQDDTTKDEDKSQED